jgi:hypothetical protein
MRLASAPKPARGIVALLVVVVAGLAAVQTAPGRGALRTAGLLAPAPGYAELAFAQPQRLPRALAGGPARVAFTVRNVEAGDRVYGWRLEAVGGGRTQVLATGRTRVRRGIAVAVRPRLQIACLAARVQVRVRLRDPRESVEFWARCAARGGVR